MEARTLNILVLFGGAGLATRGLLDAGHTCTSVELDPAKHHLSQILNPEATHITADVRTLDSAFIASFDAVWTSPPCQEHSDQKQSAINPENASLLWWALTLQNDVLWVENVMSHRNRHQNNWGTHWNAAQFEQLPRQRRRRIVGGRYRKPVIFRNYKANYVEYDYCASPAVMASELSAGGLAKEWHKERRKATRWFMDKYNRRITIEDMAYLQGFEIPAAWYENTSKSLLSEAIGNGVPVYMARAFGEAYSKPNTGIRQLPLFPLENVA